jgi:hypothetical protein
MSKSKKNEAATEVSAAPVAAVEDTRFADLAALLEALDTRVSALETGLAKFGSAAAAPTDADRTEPKRKSAKIAAEARGGATTDGSFNPAVGGAALAPDVLAKYAELQEKRQRDAAARADSRVRKVVEPGRLEQLAREFEGANVTSARMRLQDLQTKGTISDFRVLPPGSAMPADTNPARILLTTDAHGFIISADVG